MVRLKQRFIIAQIVPGSPTKFQEKLSLNSRDIQIKLREKIGELYGDVGVGEFGQATYIRYHDGKYSNIFVVKTTREAQQKVHFALSCMSEAGDSQWCIRSLAVNSCQRTCMQSLRELFAAHFACAGMVSDAERIAAAQTIEKNLSTLEL
jgi:RNase P/RNase MRP subunit POP5